MTSYCRRAGITHGPATDWKAKQGSKDSQAANHLVAEEAGRCRDKDEKGAFYPGIQVRRFERVRYHDDNGLMKDVHGENRCCEVSASRVVMCEVAASEA